MTEKLVLASVGVLGSALGALLAWVLTRIAWQRQTQLDLQKSRYQEGMEFLNELSLLVGRRYFLLQRLVWAIESGNAERMGKDASQYFQAVEEWNTRYWSNRNRIRLLVNEEYAERFLAYRDIYKSEFPRNLHYAFFRTHRVVMGLQAGRETRAVVKLHMERLNWLCTEYLEDLTAEFLSKATRLQLLKVEKRSSIPAEVRDRTRWSGGTTVAREGYVGGTNSHAERNERS